MSDSTIPARDRQVIRELLSVYVEQAARPVHAEKRALWRKLNGLEPCRPPVWINEIPWHEFKDEPELKLFCTDERCRAFENRLRLTLYQWRHFPGDMILDPEILVPLRCSPGSTYADYGIQSVEHRTGDAYATNQFVPVIDSEADVDRLRVPDVKVDREGTARDLAFMADLCAGIIGCRVRGLVHQWAAAWDQMIHWYGIERLYLDMTDRPELVHRLLRRFWDAVNCVLDRQEELGLLATGDGNWRVGSGGLGCCAELPPPACDPAHVRPRDQWGCSTGQIFSEVSPDMHWEFCLQYEKPYMERFGLSYYGCCEPLHTKMGILKRVRNLRKVSASPWADMGRLAEEAGTAYVLSYKPNPSYLAQEGWSPALAEGPLRTALDKAKGARVEIILKDVTTLRFQPRRLWEWEKMAMRVAEEWAAAQ